jgi:4-amino-4-deoxy-L-arabinose transferase-like glycosyltransferase
MTTIASPVALAPLAPSQRRELLWLAACALLVLGAGYGLREPWPSDEPRFVLVARQMFEGGSWLFPHRGHELYADKPPLYFWLLALARGALGSWRWSFLLPSLLSGLGVLALTYDLARRLWNHRAGLWAAVAVLSALQFAYQFKRAQIDPTLVFATTASLYGLLRHVLLGPDWRAYWLGCFFAGVGVILKGVGFLPLLVLLPSALMQARGWRGFAVQGGARGKWWLGALCFLAAIALWLVPMVATALGGGDAEHRAYLDNLLFKQTATRYAGAWHHHQPVWYFPAVIALFWLPFSLAFAWLWRDWRDAWRARDARTWLPLAWALLVLAFFSASPGKRDMYILPMLPAVAWAAAPYLDALLQRTGFRRALLVLALALSTLLFVAGMLGLFAPTRAMQALAAERGLGAEVRWLWGMLAAIGTLGLSAALLLRVARAPAAVGVLLVVLWCGYGFVAHPVLDASSSASGLMLRARALAGPDATIGLVAWKEQTLLQARGPTVEFGFRKPADAQLREGVAWLRGDPAHRMLMLSQPQKLAACFAGAAEPPLRVGTANRRDWFLVPLGAIGPDCHAQAEADSGGDNGGDVAPAGDRAGSLQ